MIEIIELILSNFILVSTLIIVWHILLNKKINFKSPKLYIALVVITLITIFACMLSNKLYKIYILLIVFTLFIKFLFKQSWKNSIIIAIFYQLIIMLAETFYGIVLTIILKANAESILKYYAETIAANSIIGFTSILIASLNIIKKFLKSILNLTKKIKTFQATLLCTIALVALGLFPVTIYYKINFAYLMVFYSIMIMICCCIIVYSLKTQNKYDKVSDKYNIAIKSLNDFEDMMSKYRIANHENKNLLLTVRAMILNEERDIPKYIDTIIEDKFEDDEKLLFKMNVIPSGGLRGTIYSEIMKIRDKKIRYSLNIDRKLRTIDFIDLETEEIIDICKIIGVFIDNAIEEVLKLSKKNQNIDISLFIEDSDLHIKVSNNYKNKLELEKINKPGYTTKEKGHGYGLTLVKGIVDSNENLNNITEITKNIFSQDLIIKYKK